MMKNPVIISVPRSHFLFFQSIPYEVRYSKKVKNMSKELPTPNYVFYVAALRLILSINFEPIFKKSVNFGPIFKKSVNFGRIFEKKCIF